MNIRLIFDPPRRGFGMVAVAPTSAKKCGVSVIPVVGVKGVALDSNIRSLQGKQSDVSLLRDKLERSDRIG
jgi:hypothetical protein